MANNALLLSLGHNSSAIYVNSDRIPVGYEQERLDRKKSSSNPPLDAILAIKKYGRIKNDTPVFVTHWFDSFQGLPDCKYITEDLNQELIGKDIMSHSREFTHHDAHAWSAYSFFKHHLGSARLAVDLHKKYHIIVADGFGNFQETITIYELDLITGKMMPIHKTYGYETSLGLMYQYATEFVGMKMQQDEYKFLGYESSITQYFGASDIKQIQDYAHDIGTHLVNSILNQSDMTETHGGNLINFSYLLDIREQWKNHFNLLCDVMRVNNHSSEMARTLVGFYIQNVLEFVMKSLVAHFQIENLLCAGGIFYNVKLNNQLLKSVKGFFSVVPLAGDQGAAIGFYQKFVGDFLWDTLAIGPRNFDREFSKYRQLTFHTNLTELHHDLFNTITSGRIANLCTNNMEYGPRALGNTSSLFLPRKRLSKANNSFNNRNEVMPFAPMILERNLDKVFEKDYQRVVGSDKFMIVTYDYKLPPTEKTQGVYHVYPLQDKYSGRPQVIPSGHFLEGLMDRLDYKAGELLLTNTSYNYHGEPIVYSLDDISKTFSRQIQRAEIVKQMPPKTIIYLD